MVPPPDEPGSGSLAAKKPVRVKTREEFDRVLAEHDLVLVEFYTSGCPICANMEPVLGNVARATDALVVLVNAADDLDLVSELGVQRAPTLILYKSGAEVERLDSGFQGSAPLVELVEKHAE